MGCLKLLPPGYACRCELIHTESAVWTMKVSPQTNIHGGKRNVCVIVKTRPTCLSNFEVIKINVILLTANSCGVNHYFVSQLVFFFFFNILVQHRVCLFFFTNCSVREQDVSWKLIPLFFPVFIFFSPTVSLKSTGTLMELWSSGMPLQVSFLWYVPSVP